MQLPGPERILAVRLREVRQARGLSQAALTGRLNELGLSLHQTAISKIEAHDRAVTVDELFALAIALNVTPLSLLTPTKETDSVMLTPKVSAPVTAVWEWTSGIGPLRNVHSAVPTRGKQQVPTFLKPPRNALGRPDWTEVQADYESALPIIERRWRSTHLGQLAIRLAAAVRQTISGSDDRVAADVLQRWVAELGYWAELLQLEIEQHRTSNAGQEEDS